MVNPIQLFLGPKKFGDVSSSLAVIGDATIIGNCRIYNDIYSNGNFYTQSPSGLFSMFSKVCVKDSFTVDGDVSMGNVEIIKKLIVADVSSNNLRSQNLTANSLNATGYSVLGSPSDSPMKNVSNTSTTSGALTVYGGVGITGNLFIGGQIITGTAQVFPTLNITSYDLNSLTVSGGATFNNRINVTNGSSSFTSSSTALNLSGSNSSDTSSGALVVTGGVGITQNLRVGTGINVTNGNSSFSATTPSSTALNLSGSNSSNTTSGALVVTGGVGISQNLYVGSGINVTNGTSSFTAPSSSTALNLSGTNSSGTSSGALVVTGGVGITQNLYVGSGINVTNGSSNFISTSSNSSALDVSGSYTSTSTSSGSLVVKGGVGISQNLYVGSGINVQNGTSSFTAPSSSTALDVSGSNSSSTTSGALVVKGGVGIREKLYVGSSVYATSFCSTSDYRIKDIVEPLCQGKYTVDNLNPIHYILKDTNEHSIGLIAHELQEHYPYLVVGKKDGETTQTVNYIGLIGILIHEIQQLKKRVNQVS